MPESKIRDRLVGGWRLTAFEEQVDGKTDHPLGESWLGTTQLRHARFEGPDALVLSAVSEPDARGATLTQTISWERQPPR
jgi:hypothetical protein